MIEYQVLTKAELVIWQNEHPPCEPLMLHDMHLAYFRDFSDDMPCAILALDDGRLVGRVLLTHFYLYVDGRMVRSMATQRLWVLPDYRKKAIGIALVLRAVRLGVPCLLAGVSRQMREVLDSWKSFARIDSSPIFPVALTWKGLWRKAKADHWQQARNDVGKDTRANKLAVVARCLRQSFIIARGARVSIVRPDDAIAGLDALLRPLYQVQVPWRRTLLEDALAGRLSNCFAWIVERRSAVLGQRHLLRLSLRPLESGGGDAAGSRRADLTEIYPPPADHVAACDLVSFAFHRARQLGAEAMYVYALTLPLQEYCRAQGLTPDECKTVFIAAVGVDDAVAKQLRDHEGWWCRGVDETELEEAWNPSSNPPSEASLLL